MNHTVKVAAAQLSPVYLNKSATISKACAAIEAAANEGAKLIVFPEAFISGYPDWVWVVPNAQSKLLGELYGQLIDSSVTALDPELDLISEVAGDCEINVLIGANERNAELSNSSLYNSFFLFDSDGELYGHHRKLIPTGGERTVWGQGDGSTLHSYETTAGVLSGLICWENYMPLARQVTYNNGTQILAAPTWDKSPGWIQSMQHIAREGGLFVISCCMALRADDIPDDLGFKQFYPEGREWVNVGNSCIVGPDGKLLSGPLEAEESILYAELDFRQITAAKRLFDAAGHYSRPDVFTLLSKSSAPDYPFMQGVFDDE